MDRNFHYLSKYLLNLHKICITMGLHRKNKKEEDLGLELHLFPEAAVTKYCALQGVNSGNASSPSSGGREPAVKAMAAGLVLL